jgi:hypothetical protein
MPNIEIMEMKEMKLLRPLRRPARVAAPPAIQKRDFSLQMSFQEIKADKVCHTIRYEKFRTDIAVQHSPSGLENDLIKAMQTPAWRV